ncbi:MAG: bifunctional sulfate adenylyltransferase/adenylylsulfate kinase [Desulfovibrionaceae bacterium]|nr:bifunctional sulfate adenylyltransferase/adenylylsulfate kinase [Desulfovibrionaceae bacterium]
MANAESLIVHGRRIEALRRQAVDIPSVFLDETALCDLELLLNRGYFPLCGYASQEHYHSILESMRLPDGTVWPVPITLAVPAETAQAMAPGDHVALRDREGYMLAVLRVQELWQPDLRHEALAVYGTEDPERHPAVKRLLARQGVYYLSGGVEGLSLPQRYDFMHLRRTPAQMTRLLSERGWRKVIGFQDASLLHRMHREMLLAAAAEQGARLFLSPLITPSPVTELSSFPVVRCYEHFHRRLPRESAMLGLTPMYNRQAGPRGAMLQAIVNRNYGCTHFLIHARHDDPFPGDEGFYPEWSAHEAIAAHAEELEIAPLRVRPRRYAPEFSLYMAPDEITDGVESHEVSQADLERRLARGEEIPSWYTFPEVLRELGRLHPPPSALGFTLFLTGLSGAGKSTLAKVLYIKLQECQDRPVSLLDGDIVRRHLSSELTFSREHRNLNVQRIGFVASEITKNRGIALCAPIAPYPESRQQVRDMISPWGAFIEIHMSTPLSVCEQRDRKGLYAKARAGVIHGVTGVDDPYVPPENPELRIDTSASTPQEAAELVLDFLVKRQLIAPVCTPRI